MDSFQELALPAFLHEALKKMNFEKPTAVQAQAIPPALEGKDLIASAETGSGKTAAFGIPLLTFLTNNSSKTALVLTPTRELAEQVAEVFAQLSGGRHDLRHALLIGGVGMDKQVDAIRKGARLFIGTPGRINDHIGQQTLNLSRTGFLVLDEADRMLDMGFAPQLDKMRMWLTGPRQTMLFSATMPPDIERMSAQYLKDPVRVTVGTNSKPVERIKQKLLKTTHQRKYENLVAELRRREGIVLIFGRTQTGVSQLFQRLKAEGFEVTQIHGGMNQDQRRAALEAFKTGQVRVLVATDVAARGLDVQNISHVINYELPYEPEDYIHRIGRTGRAGAEGDSLTFLTPEDDELWAAILKKLGPAQSAIEVLEEHRGTNVKTEPRGSHHGEPAGRRHPREGERDHQDRHEKRDHHGRQEKSEHHDRQERSDRHERSGSGEKRDHHGRDRHESRDRHERHDRDRYEGRDRHERHERSSSHRSLSLWARLKGWFASRKTSRSARESRDRHDPRERHDRHDRYGRDDRGRDRHEHHDRDRHESRDRHDRNDGRGRYDRHDRYGSHRDDSRMGRFKRWLRDSWNR